MNTGGFQLCFQLFCRRRCLGERDHLHSCLHYLSPQFEQSDILPPPPPPLIVMGLIYRSRPR